MQLVLLLAAMVPMAGPVARAADAAIPQPASLRGALAVVVTSPTMNAEVGEAAAIPLAASPRASADAIERVEFLDDGKPVGAVTKAPYEVTYRPAVRKLNFRITARVTDAAGHTALSSPVTCVATSNVQRRYQSYDYQEVGERGLLGQVRLRIPDGLPTVRGLLVVSNWADGDTREAYSEVWYEEFMHLHGFGFVGTKGFGSHVESVRVLEHALQQIARDANHPELVNVPFATTGFSAGGGFASRLLVEVPDRVIASVPVGSRLNFTGIAPSPASLATPACIIDGELEHSEGVVEPVLEACRPKGALYGWMTVRNAGHELCGQEVLAMPLLDAAVRLRCPKDADVRRGPVTLKRLTPDSGWVADNTTWHSGLTSIAPAKQFTGSLGKSSWLPAEDTAFIYRAYATYDRPLTIASPPADDSGRRVWDPGSNTTIVVDDSAFPNWRKLEFCDGARKLGEIAGGPPQLTAMHLRAGYHVFSVLGTDAQGNVRPSNPVLVVVRRLPAEG